MSFIKYINKPYEDVNSLRNLISYCMNEQDCYGEKVQSVSNMIYGLCPLSFETAVNDFYIVKKLYNQLEGRQLNHLVISVYKEGVSKNSRIVSAKLILDGVGKKLMKDGYQNLCFLHVKNDGNIHIHVIINNVNYITGNRLTNIQGYLNHLTYLLNKQFKFLKWDSPIYY